MKRLFVAVFAVVSVIGLGFAQDKPLWDLAKDEISAELKSGKVEKVDGKVTLKEGAAFAVPAKAFPDQKNFTVQITASLCDLVEHTLFTVMTKQSDKDDGFTMEMNYREKPYYARSVGSYINNIYMRAGGIGGKKGPQVDTPYTFTLAVRDGYATFYIDEKPYKKCFMEMVPNGEPMWIGSNPHKKSKPMNVTISSVKVYGPSFKYVSKKERVSENPRGAVAGRGWALDIPKVEHPEWSKVRLPDLAGK